MGEWIGAIRFGNKWDGQREVLLKSAMECWVAIGEALIAALGGLLIFDPSAIDDYAVLAGIRCFVAELVFVTVSAEEGQAAANVPLQQVISRENDQRLAARVRG